MPITFFKNSQEGYIEIQIKGAITNRELLRAYQDNFEAGNWAPDFNKIVDLSEADVSHISAGGLRALSAFIKEKQTKSDVKGAVYAPEPLGFGLSRMYETYLDEALNFKLFKNKEDAMRWITSSSCHFSETLTIAQPFQIFYNIYNCGFFVHCYNFILTQQFTQKAGVL